MFKTRVVHQSVKTTESGTKRKVGERANILSAPSRLLQPHFRHRNALIGGCCPDKPLRALTRGLRFLRRFDFSTTVIIVQMFSLSLPRKSSNMSFVKSCS